MWFVEWGSYWSLADHIPISHYCVTIVVFAIIDFLLYLEHSIYILGRVDRPLENLYHTKLSKISLLIISSLSCSELFLSSRILRPRSHSLLWYIYIPFCGDKEISRFWHYISSSLIHCVLKIPWNNDGHPSLVCWVTRDPLTYPDFHAFNHPC